MADTTSKKKKLPFKPTALRRAPKPSQADEEKKSDADDLDLFRRRKEMEPIMAQDLERRQRRKQKREEEERKRAIAEGKRPRASTDEEEKAPQKSPSRSREASQQVKQFSEGLYDASPVHESRSVTSESFSKLATPPPSKRCRVGSASSSKRPSASIEPRGSSLEGSPTARRLQRQQYLNPSKPPPLKYESSTTSNLPIISLDSDSEEDVKPIFPSVKNRSPSMEILDLGSPPEIPPAPEPEPEEDEFAEYIRRAESQRARHQAPVDSLQDDTLKKENTEIYISSVMPGAHAVVFKFLFNKELRLAKNSWIAIQGKNGNPIPADQHDDVVLTWRRRRVYNSSCLLDLGIRPLGDGRLGTTSQGRDGFAKERTRVHMEAWTQEAFQQMEQEQELQRKREAGEISDAEEEPEVAAEEVRLRIILKARDLEPVKLTCRPETTVETLLTGFRSQRQIGSDRDVSLSFDGETLEEHVTMDEAEIDDMDTIDVYIK